MNIRKKYQVTRYCHHFLEEYIKEGARCIDATCGNGNDTVFLCDRAGKDGTVYGFDIQEEAVAATAGKLEETGMRNRAQLYCAGHERMREFIHESVDVIMFNFGYLPGGDHRNATKPDTSVEAVRQGLSLLKTGGIMSLCIYSGRDTGYEEKEKLLSFLKNLDTSEWLVIVNSFYNRKNDPPLPVFVIRLDSNGKRGTDDV